MEALYPLNSLPAVSFNMDLESSPNFSHPQNHRLSNVAVPFEGPRFDKPSALLGGSWVVSRGVIGGVATVQKQTITHILGLVAPLVTTLEPPSKP